MNDFTKKRKLLKYGTLQHLPGKRGRRYYRKYKGILAREEFEEAVCRSKGLTCIDLGANVGKFSRIMAVTAKRVIAFEPDPWACARLQANVADLDNVRIENAAAGTSDGKVLLYRRSGFTDNPASHSQSSSVIADKTNIVSENAVEVRQVDFIRYLEELDENTGVLKMDIEGAEVELLESLFDRPDLLKRIDQIYAETHESRIPGHEPRVRTLRKRAEMIQECKVNLYWL